MQPEPGKNQSPSLRFGVLCTGTAFQRWQKDALDELREHGHRLVLLIKDDRIDTGASGLTGFFKRDWAHALFLFAENRIFKPDARKPADMHDDLAGTDLISCRVDRKGYAEYFTAADIGKIRGYRLDFILRFGFSIIRGDILSAAIYGVWSFHHDDETKYRGGPPGFWEISHGDPVSAAILQRLTEKLDGGVILKKGYLKTVAHSYKGNLEQLLTVSSSWPAQAADEIAAGRTPDNIPSGTRAPVLKLPGNLRMTGFFLKLLWNRVQYHLQDLFAPEEWNIGVIRKPVRDIALQGGKLNLCDISWLPPAPRGCYAADPSGFLADGRLHILFERYDYREGKAVISETEWPEDPVKMQVNCVIQNGYHLSYPFIAEYGGETWCLPESYRSGAVTLYRRDHETGKFLEEKTLIPDVRAVDPTLLHYDNRWWLFFTEQRHSSTHLHIWHSAELTGVYQPHVSNPVKIDVRSARPAGTPFIHEGILYRPAQDCSVTYGGRVVINRIEKLTTSGFLEKPVNVVEPVAGTRYGKGLHTLSGAGDYTLIDGKRFRFNRHHFFRRLGIRLHYKKR